MSFEILGVALILGALAMWVSKRGVNTHLKRVWDDDTGDPIDDTDRRMANGIYDQAFSIIESAIEKEPNRHDLKFKGAEVLFVWGKYDKFLEFVRKHQQELMASPDWSRVCILGAEACPNEPLFAIKDDE